MVRLVAQAPELIKPYWVILDAKLYSDTDCSVQVAMRGDAFSSGEYVIKYATYGPSNAWDGKADTSWAAKEPCTPGNCYVGLSFRKPLQNPPMCLIVEHPEGAQYHATAVSLQTLGKSGWEEVADAVVRLLPDSKGEEL